MGRQVRAVHVNAQARIGQAWQWEQRGACRRADPELFFHAELERGVQRRRREAAALLVCVRCPVLRACREHALERGEVYGVWGGLTEEQREQVRRARVRRRRSPGTG